MKLKDEDFSMEFLEGDQRGLYRLPDFSYRELLVPSLDFCTSSEAGVLDNNELAVYKHVHFLSNMVEISMVARSHHYVVNVV